MVDLRLGIVCVLCFGCGEGGELCVRRRGVEGWVANGCLWNQEGEGNERVEDGGRDYLSLENGSRGRELNWRVSKPGS